MSFLFVVVVIVTDIGQPHQQRETERSERYETVKKLKIVKPAVFN